MAGERRREPLPRGWEIHPLRGSAKTEQMKWWTVIFVDPSRPRPAHLARPPPFSPQRPGGAGRGEGRQISDPGCARHFPSGAARTEWPVLHSSCRNHRSRAGRRRFGGGAGAARTARMPGLLPVFIPQPQPYGGAHGLAWVSRRAGPSGPLSRPAAATPHRPGDRPNLGFRAARSAPAGPRARAHKPQTQTHRHTRPSSPPAPPRGPSHPRPSSRRVPFSGARRPRGLRRPLPGGGEPGGGECLAAPAPRASDWARRSPPSPAPSLPLGPLPRALPAHSGGRACRGRRFFHTLVGSRAPRSVTGELAARRRLPPARTRARPRGFRRLLPAAGRRGSPGPSVGRRRKRRRREEDPGAEARGGGREACHLQPPLRAPKVSGSRRRPRGGGSGRRCAPRLGSPAPGTARHARAGGRGGLRGVCGAEGMALPARARAEAAAGAGLEGWPGRKPGRRAPQGASAGGGGGVGCGWGC